MRRPLVMAIGAVLVGTTPGQAQDWEYTATLYGWVPSLGTEIDTPLGNVDKNPNGSDILDALDGTFMGVFTARTGPWAFTADIDYAALSSDQEAPAGLVFANFDLETDITMINVKALYRFTEGPSGSANLTAGLRWYDLSVKTEFKSNTVANRSFATGDKWTDLTFGASGYTDLSEDWYLVGMADVGGFGLGESSELSWQVFGAAGYRFNETWSAELGYRHLSIKQKVASSDIRLEMSGPIIGVTAKF